MIELGVAIVLIVLLLIILFIYRARKRTSKKAKPAFDYRTPGLAKQLQEINSDHEPVLHFAPKSEPSVDPNPDVPEFNTELEGGHSVEIQADEPAFDTGPSIALLTNETLIPALPENRCENLPQDSMLRRHYLTHLHAMIESLKPPRPTDSALSRHYDAMVIAEMEQCLSNEATMKRLVCDYEECKKTLARQIQKPEAIAEPLIEPAEAGITLGKPKLVFQNTITKNGQ